MHFGVLGERQTVRQIQLGYGGRHTQQLGYTKHDKSWRPTAAAAASHKLQTQVNAVVAAVARTLGIHDQHDYGPEYLVDILLDFGLF